MRQQRLPSGLVLPGLAILMICTLSGVASAGPVSGNYHWGRQQPTFSLQVGDNVDGGWDDLLPHAMADWNKNDTVTLKQVKGSSSPQRCPETTGIVEVCNWPYGTQEGWLGLTRLYFDDTGDYIAAATVQLNDSFFDQANGTYNSDAARKHTICHELGHTMGLDHVDTASCLNPSQTAVFQNLTPIKQDFRDLARIYARKDPVTTVKGKQKDPERRKNRKDDKKRHGGQHRHRTATESVRASSSTSSATGGLAGPETTYVEQLEDGRRVVTIVTWAKTPALAAP
ncbi:MAG: hypothetical protein U0075_25050 [Thermomicrobiales bacterium]